MNLVELELDETLADFEVQDWIDNVFSVQYPDVKARIKKGCSGICHKKDEWHYVKDELPRKSDSTLCELMPVFVAVKVGYHIETYGTYWNLKIGKFECLDEIYAWCYTPEPPELPKESE